MCVLFTFFISVRFIFGIWLLFVCVHVYVYVNICVRARAFHSVSFKFFNRFFGVFSDAPCVRFASPIKWFRSFCVMNAGLLVGNGNSWRLQSYAYAYLVIRKCKKRKNFFKFSLLNSYSHSSAMSCKLHIFFGGMGL